MKARLVIGASLAVLTGFVVIAGSPNKTKKDTTLSKFLQSSVLKNATQIHKTDLDIFCKEVFNKPYSELNDIEKQGLSNVLLESMKNNTSKYEDAKEVREKIQKESK